jgi:hypothetical protein
MSASAAELAVARQKVKQAQDACRKAAQRLAHAEGGHNVYGTLTCADARDADRARALIALACSEHDRVEVVVLIAQQ